MQLPTCSGIRVRSARDANVLFHAVALNILPLITRRLDEAERLQVQSGCVYVWEERSSSYFEASGQEMKRFTEGRSWGPSKARDEFLYYYEKENGTKSQMVERMKSGSKSRSQLVKQTYSVNVRSPDCADVKKWHLNAYYYAEDDEPLRTVDEIAELKDLKVPHEQYSCARTSRAREAAIRSHAILSAPHDQPIFTHQFSSYRRSGDSGALSYQSSESNSSSDESSNSPLSSPEMIPSSLAPLEYLENLPQLGRHPVDDQSLRLFDMFTLLKK